MSINKSTYQTHKKFKAKRINKAIDIAGIAMWEYNCQTEECLFNSNWYTILGYEPFELPMEISTFFDLLHPEDKPCLEEAVSNFDKTQPEGILEIQYRMKSKSGKWVWVRNRSSLELDENGDPLIWLGSVFDISRLKESENIAIQNHNHLDALVNSLSDIIYEIDSEYNLINTWAPKNHKDYDKIKSFRGKNLKDVYSQRKFEHFKKLIDNTLKTNSPQNYTYHTYRTDLHYLARATPLQKQSGKPCQVTMVIQDVTDIERTQQSLKTNQANLNAIIQNTSDVFWAIDKNENMIVFNKAFDELLYNLSGNRPEVGQWLDDSFLLEETAKRWRHIHSRSLKGLDTEFSKVLHFRDGRMRLYEFHINPYRSEDGEIVGSVVTGRDIDDIYSAKKQAEKAARLKSKFVSTISHEIRTPLNAILGTCHQLAKVNIQENLIEDIEILQLASDNLLSLINDVLDFTKLDSGKTKVKNTDVHLPSFLKAIGQFQNRLSENKGLKFNFIQVGDIPDWIIVDKTKLHQILTNVISNAIKYTHQGKIDFKVTGSKQDRSRVKLTFEITDTGIGIPSKELDGIFDSFTQSSTSYNLLKGGTGLGLAITKNLVNLLNGDISVNSKLKHGSTFQLQFTFQTTLPKMTIPALTPLQNNYQEIKVLIAEDNEINAKIITRLLDQWNIAYDLAENGQKAVDFAAKNDYSLILMDIQMPIMNGYEASYMIKNSQLKLNTETPIVALTAQSDFSFNQNYKEGVFTSSILKPFHPESLKSSIFSYIATAN